MERSVDEYPLALAYRNLAVYWNSEGDLEQGNAYTQKALALNQRTPKPHFRRSLHGRFRSWRRSVEDCTSESQPAAGVL